MFWQHFEACGSGGRGRSRQRPQYNVDSFQKKIRLKKPPHESMTAVVVNLDWGSSTIEARTVPVHPSDQQWARIKKAEGKTAALGSCD